jgi:hypothetical protein
VDAVLGPEPTSVSVPSLTLADLGCWAGKKRCDCRRGLRDEVAFLTGDRPARELLRLVGDDIRFAYHQVRLDGRDGDN